MKWVVYIEIAFVLFFLGGAIYSSKVAKSADEEIIAAPLYFGAAIMVVITILTLLGWWGWMVSR